MRAKTIFFIISIFILSECATRKFTINSDPSNAKVYYQSRKDTVFKGYTPIDFDDDTANIGPGSKIMVSKDGFFEKEVNIGGFEGTDISLLVTLEPMKKEQDEVIIEEKPKATSEIKKDTPESVEKKELKEEKAAMPVEPKKENGKEEAVSTLPVDVPPAAIPPNTVMPEVPKDLAEQEKEAENKDILKEEDDEFTALAKKLADMERMLENLKKEKKEIPSGLPGQDLKKEQTNTNKAMAHLFNAQKLIQLKRLNEALVETYKALQLDNTLAYAFAIQGSIYFLKRDYYSAISAWEKAVELDPSNYEVINVLNRVKARMGTKY